MDECRGSVHIQPNFKSYLVFSQVLSHYSPCLHSYNLTNESVRVTNFKNIWKFTFIKILAWKDTLKFVPFVTTLYVASMMEYGDEAYAVEDLKDASSSPFT